MKFEKKIIICLFHQNGVLHTNSKLLANLTGWKTEYLISQLRAGFEQKLYRLKTCPQGVLQAQYEKSFFFSFLPLSSVPVWLKICYLSECLVFKPSWPCSGKLHNCKHTNQYGYKVSWYHLSTLKLPHNSSIHGYKSLQPIR